MGKILASERADGLTIEESFYLYILAQNWANGDEFSWNCGGLEEEKRFSCGGGKEDEVVIDNYGRKG